MKVEKKNITTVEVVITMTQAEAIALHNDVYQLWSISMRAEDKFLPVRNFIDALTYGKVQLDGSDEPARGVI